MYLSAMVKRELPRIAIKIYDLHLESIKAARVQQIVNWEAMVCAQIDEFKTGLGGT